MTRWVASGLAALLLLLAVCGTAAWAEGKPAKVRARALFQKAQRYFDVGDFATARQHYLEAYQAYPLPGFLFNIGQCYRREKRHAEALRLYRQYLLKAPDAKNRATVEKLIALSKAEVAKQRGDLSPKGSDGAGSSGSGAAGATGTTRPGGGDDRDGADDRRDDRGDSGTPRRRWSRGLVIGGVAVSLALFTTGIITGMMAKDRSDQFNDRSTPRTNAELQKLEDSGRALGATCIVTIAAGSTAAVATLIYFLAKRGGGSSKRRDHKRREATKTPLLVGASASPLPGGAAVLLQGRF
ncbi:MAG: tetratricopeptide repeat protein [Myxococcales bacterium]|nr:tetratricopeptide repeat protein [Myxococcales bacterium]